MNLSRLISTAAIACALALGAGCESIDIPSMSPDHAPDQPGLSFEPSGNATTDAYDLILYDRIERNWRDTLGSLSALSKDYQYGRVKVQFRLHQDGRISDLKIVERTVGYRQTAACWEAIRKVRNLPSWPREVRRRFVHRDYRDLNFIFYYSSHYTRLVRCFSVAERYDQELINSIQKKWYNYLDATTAPIAPGEVTVEFLLHRDGTVTDAQVTKSSVSERLAELCRQAVLDAGTFPVWPEDMRDRIGRDSRKHLFRFYFH